MNIWLEILPIVIYLLLIVLLIIGIILGIKCIITMEKIDTVVDSVNKKVESLNGVFNIIDYTSDKLSLFTDRIVDLGGNLFNKIFLKKKKKKHEGEDDYE